MALQVSALIVRQANSGDLDNVYLAGSDAWREGDSIESYLKGFTEPAMRRLASAPGGAARHRT